MVVWISGTQNIEGAINRQNEDVIATALYVTCESIQLLKHPGGTVNNES